MGEGLKRARRAARETQRKTQSGAAESRRKGAENIGRTVRAMVGQLPAVTEWGTDVALGEALQRCMEAGYEATLPGRQKNRQIDPEVLEKFRANFNRQAAREYRKLAREANKRRAEVSGGEK